MIPTAWVTLAALPRTASGKLDRRGLPTPAAAEEGVTREHRPPRTAVEELLAGIWCEVLGRERIGLDDDFFALGGHSLLAAQVLSRVREVLGIDLELRQIFSEPRLGRLAEEVTEQLLRGAGGAGGEDAAAVPRLAPASRGAAAPLSYAQQRLWFLERLQPGSGAYHMPAAVRLRGRLDVAALGRSLDEVVRRHEALRTRIVEVDSLDTAVQQVLPAESGLLRVVDLGGLDEAARERELAERVRAEVERPFDLAAGPLVRAALLGLGAEEHALLVTMHHIASDGWSVGVLVRELGELYAAFAAGRPSPLPELAIQYADYALWQRSWLVGEELGRRLAHWRERLAEVPALDLPTDRRRPAALSLRGAAAPVRLGGELAAVRDLCRREGATLFMALLAAFRTVLWCFGGQRDVAIGTPVANRGRLELERLIGFFVNSLALRTEVRGEESFRDLLRRERETALAAYAHQEVPFERVVEAVAAERSLAKSPLFQVMLTLQNAPASAVRLPGLSLTELGVEPRTSQYEISVVLREVEEGLGGMVVYSTDLFEAATVGRLMLQLGRVLAEGATRPERPLGAFDLLGEEERRQVLVEWNRTGRDWGEPRPIHEIFAARAGERPEAVAVASAGEAISYGELARLSNRLANRLQAAGVERGPGFVPVCVAGARDALVAFLALLQCRRAFVPIDLGWPASRQERALARVASPVVIVDREGATAPLGAAAAVPIVADDMADDGASPHAARFALGFSLNSAPDLDAPLYAIFTSGSTGEPKAAIATQRGILNRLLWMDEEIGPAAAAVVLQTTRHVFDSAVWQLLWPLLHGGVVVLPEAERVADRDELFGSIARHGCTMTDFVPSVLRSLLRGPGDGAGSVGTRDARLATLHTVIVGGEECTWPLVAAFRAAAPEVRLLNLYGPTEASIGCIWSEPGGLDAPADPATRVPIGRPIANCRAYVLDDLGGPVPLGAAGELHLAGACVGPGYLGAPELDRGAFVEHTLGGVPERLYRTGDRARWRPDGKLEFLGRIDEQVKIHGYRIELGEVQAALESLPEVAEAAIVAAEDEVGGRRLVAYVVGRGGTAGVAVAELRRALQGILPAPMVPAAWVVLEALPRTAGGKLDRKALPPPAAAVGTAGAVEVAPRTAIEELLARIWCEVLGRERVGVEDSFFALGGDSIQSLQVVARARRAGIALTPREMFEHQTIAELARVARPTTPATDPGPLAGPVPLLPIARRFFAKNPDGPGHFNQAVLLALPPLPAERGAAALRVAVRQLAQHHDSLRGRFAAPSGRWEQTIMAADAADAADAGDAAKAADTEDAAGRSALVVDLAAVPDERLGGAVETAAAWAQAALDLRRGPLFQAVLFACGAGRPARLLLAIHHLAVDAVSWGFLLEDLHTALFAALEGRAVAMPAKTSSIQAWAERLLDRAHSGALDGELAHWRHVLAGVRPLPRDGAGENTFGSARRLTVTLAAVASARLLDPAGPHGAAQVEPLLLAALALALHRWCGWQTVVVDVEGHGREDLFPGIDLSRTAGWFTALYPVRLDLPSGAPEGLPEALATPGRGLGYGLARYLKEDGELRGAPEPEVCLNYLGRTDRVGAALPGFALAAEDPGPMQGREVLRPHLLDVECWIGGGRLEARFTYPGAVYRESTIRRLAADFLAALEDLASGERAERLDPADFPLVDLDEEALARIATIARLAEG